DLEFIGAASTSKQEDDFGLLVLDELAMWFNSRTYQDKSRQPVINWLLHSRHLQWDLILLVQDIELIDKQARKSINEHTVICRRTDRLPLPVLGFLYRFATGKKFPLPRIHIGSVFYGSGLGAVKVETWTYRGTDLFKAYNTNQIFDSENQFKGAAVYLPPCYLNTKRFAKKDGGFYMRLTRIYLKRFSRPLSFALGLLSALVVFVLILTNTEKSIATEKVMQQEASKSGVVEPVVASVKQKEKDKPVPPVIKHERIRLNYASYEHNGKRVYKILFQDKIYSPESFPHRLTWIDGKPYAFFVEGS
ncbi:MAG: hypothetical protein KAS32_27805, partial [Candidatus Peribacteraceae bacterium]|nr:hypothetical protein [Candidatus Peribacteraceae bacterium]